jgi:hypothetical protein
MTFRTRILLSTIPVVLIPLVVFGLGVRRAMRQQIAAQYRGRVTALVDLIGQDLERQGTLLATRLARLRTAAAADNRLRLAAVARDTTQRGYALDYAGTAMRLAGLDMLQIQDDSARIVSSGHFRNEFDRVERGLPQLLPGAPNGFALVQARTPEGPFFTLARLDSLPLGERQFTVVGGFTVDSGFLARLARDSALTVSLVLPRATISSRPGAAGNAADVVSELPVPFVDAVQPDSARLVAARSKSPHRWAACARSSAPPIQVCDRRSSRCSSRCSGIVARVPASLLPPNWRRRLRGRYDRPTYVRDDRLMRSVPRTAAAVR